MSIIPVLEPSKEGKATYLVASTLIILASTAFFAWLLNLLLGYDFSLAPTVTDSITTYPIVQILPYVLPFAGLGAILLWGIEPEKRIVERMLMKKLLARESWGRTKLYMAVFFMYIRPWETSPIIEPSLDDALNGEYRRITKGPEFKEHISRYHNVFWAVFLTTISFFDMGLVFPVMWYLWPLGFPIGLGVSIPLWKQNHAVVERIADFALTRWVYETTSNDIKRRVLDAFQRKPPHVEYIESARGVCEPIINLVVQKDWAGFDRNSKNVEGLIPTPIPELLSWDMMSHYLNLLYWCAIPERRVTTTADRFLTNASSMIPDALSYYSSRSPSLTQEELIISEALKHMALKASNVESLLSLDESFFEGFSKLAIDGGLRDEAYLHLSSLPFLVRNRPIKRHLSLSKGPLVASSLFAACDDGIFDYVRILKLSFAWGVGISVFKEMIGKASMKAILENDIGYPPRQLREVSVVLYQRVREFGKFLDLNRVGINFQRLKEVYGKDEVVELIRSIVGPLPSVTDQKPRDIAELFSKLYDQWDSEDSV